MSEVYKIDRDTHINTIEVLTLDGRRLLLTDADARGEHLVGLFTTAIDYAHAHATEASARRVRELEGLCLHARNALHMVCPDDAAELIDDLTTALAGKERT